MVYLFYGLETYLINKEIKKVLLDQQIDKINTNYYDLETDTLENMIEDAGMLSLFGDKKGLICTNALIFTGKKNFIEQNIEMLERYLNDLNPTTTMIFEVDSEKLDERKKIVKLIKEKGIVKTFTNSGNINHLVRDMFDDYKISFEDINLLIDRVGKNLDILEQEVTKLKLFRFLEKEISSTDIKSLSVKNVDADIFGLIDAIVVKNKEKAITIYHDMLLMNEEPIKIIVMLANQFRLMYQAKELALKGNNEATIASMLDIHPYRIKLALEKSRAYNSHILLSYLDQLADLDINIKTGLVEKNLGFELFILGL